MSTPVPGTEHLPMPKSMLRVEGDPTRACPVDHGTGSRSQMLIEATSMVPW